MNNCLNLGCDVWKLPGFTNIDLNKDVHPDLLLNLTLIENHFGKETVDFIYAGHVFEHFKPEVTQDVINQCFNILKPFRSLLAVVPDWRKTISIPDAKADDIILAKGDHKMLMSANRLKTMLKLAGFEIVEEISDLNQIPYLLVSDVSNPIPDPWQTAFIAFKI